jgi:type I restriction enzyme S subunit
MPNVITDNIDVWTSANIPKSNGGRGRGARSSNQSPHGIKKLRELILELAVRGKLVPQDKKDEPASVLLQKIAKEKSRLIKEGKIKKQKPMPEITDDENSFDLPVGWVWVRNGSLFKLRKGKVPKDLSKTEASIPYLDIEALDRGNVLRYTDDTNSPQSIKNDILVVCDGSRSGLVLDGQDGAIGSTLAVIETPLFIQSFVKLIFRQGYEHLNSTMKGAAIPHLDTKKMFLSITGLPPLEEQHRIVAKVDELMALCDQLEQQQTDSVAAHQTLVETLLAILTDASNANELAAARLRLANHFDTLFTTEQSIDQLKQTILQLAVMGKLVPQDPNDEPASVLLEKIAKEKTRLIKEGTIKKQKPLAAITDDEKPCSLPNGWVWTRIGDASIFTEYGMSEKTFHDIDGIPVFKMGDIQDGRVVLGGQKLVKRDVESLPGLFLKKWDVLYNRTNSAELVGKTGIYEGPDDHYTFASYLIRIRCSKNYVHPRYLNLYMNTSLYRTTQIEPFLKQQCGQANVNGTIMRNMVVPVPPIAEQKQILLKAEELMAMCDMLKDRLNKAQITQIQLADAIVEKAVA